MSVAIHQGEPYPAWYFITVQSRNQPLRSQESAGQDKKGCHSGLLFVCLGTMEPHHLSTQMAIYYVMGIIAAAIVFRIIRARRRRRDRHHRAPF